MRFPTRKAVDKFNRIFQIIERPDCQDWEIECADPLRIEEYIACYFNDTENDDERFTLMALMLGCFEEYHHLQFKATMEYWGEIKKILEEDTNLHKDHITYYQSFEDVADDENVFPITPFIRRIKSI